MAEGKGKPRAKRAGKQWTSPTPGPPAQAHNIFVDYLSKEEIAAGLGKQKGDQDRIWTASIRVNYKNFREAFASDPDGGVDILFPSLEARNRALDGDVVAYKLYPDAVFESVERNISTITLEDSGAEVPSKTTQFIQKRARVVGIIEPRHSRKAIGCFSSFDKATKIARLSPTDPRIPRLCIPLSQCPEDLSTSFSRYTSMLFAVRIVDWPTSSDMARGEVIKALGTRGDLKVETAAILEFQNINEDDFSEEVLACLPEGEFTISDEEAAKRRDLRGETAFTIDPDTARDMDDAIHCKVLDDGNVEVGVHIADVTYFVEAGSTLDTEASLRCTSTYLINRVVPMLPHRLSNDLCSLRAHEDRLAVSVVWKLSPDGAILDIWMGRSLIHSRAKLSYRVAQEVLDDPEMEWSADYLNTDAKNAKPIVTSLIQLSAITKKLRERRAVKGFLAIQNSDRLSFALDENGEPCGCQSASHYGTQKLIEELMLLANIAVAGEIHRRCKNTALLRMHGEPQRIKLKEVETFGRRVGTPIDCDSVLSLQQSLAAIKDTDGDGAMRSAVICQKLLQAFQPAKYYTLAAADADGWSRHHYALNEVLYTHFTSPIRRYADVIVHRQLLASIEKQPEDEAGAEGLLEVTARCNEKRRMAKNAGEDSSSLYFAAFARLAGPLVEDAVVIEVLDRSWDVMLLNYAGVYRIHCNSLPLKKFDHDKSIPSLTLHWKTAHPAEAAAEGSSPVHSLRLFQKIKVVIRCEERQGNPLSLAVYLQAPPGCSSDYGLVPAAAGADRGRRQRQK